MKTRIWTSEEKQFLIDNYPTTSTKYCAQFLGRTDAAVNMQAFKLGIKSRNNQKTHEQYEQELLDREIDYWPLEKYVNNATRINHTCVANHVWKALPNDILKGIGCPYCAKTGFDSSKPAILYYVKIVKDNLTYYKVGITNRSVKDRFRSDSRETLITVLMEQYFEIGSEARDLEKEILSSYPRVSVPELLIGGFTELFETDVLGLDT